MLWFCLCPCLCLSPCSLFTALTASTVCLMTLSAHFPSSDQSSMLFHVHVTLLDSMTDNQSLIMTTVLQHIPSLCFIYTLSFQPAFLTNLNKPGGLDFSVFATPLHFSLPPSQYILITQVGWTLSTYAMTHVHTSLEGGGTRREPCLGMTAIALSLALLPGMFWKVPCPTTLCCTSAARSILLVCAVPCYAKPCCAVLCPCPAHRCKICRQQRIIKTTLHIAPALS
jgi:hypothetical protein